MKTDRSESHRGSKCKECVARLGNFPVKKTSTGSVLRWFTGLDCTRKVFFALCRDYVPETLKNTTHRENQNVLKSHSFHENADRMAESIHKNEMLLYE